MDTIRPDQIIWKDGKPIGVRGAEKPEPVKEREPNTWEARYAAEILEPLKLAGEVLHYEFEPFRLPLIKGFYKPDYLVLWKDRPSELHEVKGHMRQHARQRLTDASWRHWWFVFVLVTRDAGGWHQKIQPPHA